MLQVETCAGYAPRVSSICYCPPLSGAGGVAAWSWWWLSHCHKREHLPADVSAAHRRLGKKTHTAPIEYCSFHSNRAGDGEWAGAGGRAV